MTSRSFSTQVSGTNQASIARGERKFPADPPVLGKSSVWLLVYKVMVTALMASLTVAHMVANLERLGWKWLIFLTNQCMLLIILHNTLHIYLIARWKCFIPNIALFLNKKV